MRERCERDAREMTERDGERDEVRKRLGEKKMRCVCVCVCARVRVYVCACVCA